ncbi:MAG: type VI secretion system tube protein Hcp [Novosphingobium sp.]|nr:type VI secretion system tube protein Hcp [Novosphingobium sp.]
MAVDIFIEVEGIEGESQKVGREGWIDILSYSFAITQSGDFHEGGAGGGGAGRADVSDLTIMKRADNASAVLFNACAQGRYIGKVTLIDQKPPARPDADPIGYYKITLEDVMVSSFSSSGADKDQHIMESVSFNCAKMSFDYKVLDEESNEKAVVSGVYDIRRNVATA